MAATPIAGKIQGVIEVSESKEKLKRLLNTSDFGIVPTSVTLKGPRRLIPRATMIPTSEEGTFVAQERGQLTMITTTKRAKKRDCHWGEKPSCPYEAIC